MVSLAKREDKYFALKVLKKKRLVKTKQVDHMYNEICIQTAIKHSFIVNSHGFTQDSRNIYVLLDFVQGGEFFSFLRRNKTLDAKDSAFYLAQMVLAIEHLHSKNVVFRDLKPENMLIDRSGYLKLADFGFAKQIKGRTFTLCGTPEYLAPEILINRGHTKAVDWWTIGILLYEMIAGIDPFSASSTIDIYKNILRGKIRFARSFDKSAKSLVKHLLKADLSERYGCLVRGVKDIKQHRFFREFDWEAVEEMKIKPPYVPGIK